MKSTSYLSWKKWQPSSFAQLSRANSFYYAAELRRAGVTHSSSQLVVLEVGFGNGEFLRYATNQGWNISGTEINEQLLVEAQQQGFIVHDQDFEPHYPSDTVDLVVAFDVVEHIPPDQVEFFLESVKNVLRPGGIFLARFPNADSPFGLEGQNGDPSHLNAIGVGKIKYYAAQAGFQIRFLGPAASPIRTGRLASTLRTILIRPVHHLLDVIVRAVFLPGSGVSFASRNTTCILTKP